MTTATEPLRAFHGSADLKLKFVKRMDDHIAADELIQRVTGRDGKGCFVFCALDVYPHHSFPTEVGLPVWLAFLAEQVFETLSLARAREFSARFFPAIAPGADLDPVLPRFLAFLNRENLARVLADEPDEAIRESAASSIRAVIALCDEGAPKDDPRWDEVENAAGVDLDAETNVTSRARYSIVCTADACGPNRSLASPYVAMFDALSIALPGLCDAEYYERRDAVLDRYADELIRLMSEAG